MMKALQKQSGEYLVTFRTVMQQFQVFQMNQDGELDALRKHLLTPGKLPAVPVTDVSSSSGLLPTPSPQVLHGSTLDAAASSLFLKSMKLDVPRFDGTCPLSWISHIDRFFNFHGTPDPLRLQIAAFHLDGPTAVWYVLMENNNMIPRGWSSYGRFTFASVPLSTRTLEVAFPNSFRCPLCPIIIRPLSNYSVVSLV